MKHFLTSKLRLLPFVVMLFASIAVSAQIIAVSGTVSDNQGEPIAGATVSQTGTSNASMTDNDGIFTINVPSDGTLTVSFMGFNSQTIYVNNRKVVNVTMSEEVTQLQEVVAIGYGTQKKTDITGAVASIKPEKFNKGNTANPLGLIQGKVAGLNIVKNGGDDPAQNSYNVQLRGVGSLLGTVGPLYVIDGIIGGDLASVNPNDIESIDVLKDGSAAAIYGTRATGGVILITTKRGTGAENVTTAQYSTSVSTGYIVNTPRVLTAQEYREKMVANGFGADFGANTNWLKAITRTPISISHNLSIYGKNYRASVSYKNVEGLAKKSDYDEINARFAANQKALDKKLDLAYDIAYTNANKSWANYDNFNQALRANPTMPIKTDDPAFEKYAGYFESDNFYSRNPVSDMEQTTNDQKDQSIVGSIRATLNILNNLKYSVSYSIQNKSSWGGKYQPSTLRAVSGMGGVASQWQTYDTQQLIENTLQYIKTWNDKHNFQALLGQGYQINVYQWFSASNSNFPLDKLLYNNLGLGEGIIKGGTDNASVGSNKYQDKLASYFARVMYNYDEKYYLSASIRFDGSSKFGPKANKVLGPWGVFPGISGSWDIKRENFLKDNTSIDDLKLRVGYGISGHMPDSHYEYAVIIETKDAYVFSDGKFIQPWGAQNNLNEGLRWETKQETNVGVDMAFLKNRLSFTIDGYFRNTNGLLYNYDVPVPPYVVNKYMANYGVIHNYGIELLVNGTIIDKSNFAWTAGINAAWNKNQCVRITGDQYGTYDPNTGKLIQTFEKVGYITNGDGETGTYVMRLAEGEPIGNFWGWKYYGINDKGEWVFKTPAGGYTTNPQDADKMILGNAQPLIIGGFNTAIRYKNFDFTLNFRGQIGGLIFNETRYFYENTRSVENALESAFEGDAALLTAWKTSGASNASIRRFSDFYLENASYLKLNDFTIGYSPELNESIKKFFTNMRFTLTGQNLFTITGYKGHDPSSVNMSGIEPGFDGRSYYPTQTSIILGLSCTF